MIMTKYTFKRDIDNFKTEYNIENRLKKYLKKANNTIFIIDEKIYNSKMFNNYSVNNIVKYKDEYNIEKTKLYMFWRTVYNYNTDFKAIIILYSSLKHKIIYNILNVIFIEPIDKIIMSYYGYEIMETIEYFSNHLDLLKYLLKYLGLLNKHELI